KIKASSVLLRFEGQALSTFMSKAQALADELDPQFLWEVCGRDEFAFDALAREYFGHPPSPLEAAAVAIRLHASPIHFYKRGKGRYQAAPEENLKAALAGLERKRRQQEQVDAWAGELAAGRVPEAVGAKLDLLLFKPDKMSLEWRALDEASARASMSPPRFLASTGVLGGPEDYFLRRFAFEHFPEGLSFPAHGPLDVPEGLPDGPARAFSIDDQETTEIDDAFSVEPIEGGWRIGVHIAAPTVFFDRAHALESIARERLSTVYFPGGKITMLPEEAVAAATLAEGRRVPAASLYLDVRADGFGIARVESRFDWIKVETNLRVGELERRLNEASLSAGRVDGAHGEALVILWNLATRLKALRGAGEDKAERPDYTIRVAEGRVAIERRARGTPVDTVVSELMIHVNATWGKALAERGYAALFRNQKGGKTRMEVEPGAHEWLGVSHYAWTSSPLRRYVDLANQRQLHALLRQAPPAYESDELAAAGRAFEATYDAYAEHQRLLERYWTVKYVQQEGIAEAAATVVRDDLVRLDDLPLVCRTIGLPGGTAPGEKVRVAFGEADLWEAHLPCRYAGK
ncbi:MAG: ribonuclease catalytic domain-containing protein, partial [Bacillota bacterium]